MTRSNDNAGIHESDSVGSADQRGAGDVPRKARNEEEAREALVEALNGGTNDQIATAIRDLAKAIKR